MSAKDQLLTWENIVSVIGEKAMLLVKARSELQQDMDLTIIYYHKLIATRNYYISQETHILQTFHKSKSLWAASYPIDWSNMFTPIEFPAWCSIRSKGRIVLYP
jgi:hypothetical protein